jgi:hypothetical protein
VQSRTGTRRPIRLIVHATQRCDREYLLPNEMIKLANSVDQNSLGWMLCVRLFKAVQVRSLGTLRAPQQNLAQSAA